MSTPLVANDKQSPLFGAPSFSRTHRIKRAIWFLVWGLFASWTPAPMHRWRVFLLKLAGANVHSTVHVYGSTRVWYPPDLVMEANSCLGPRVNCYNMAPIRIGAGAIVSQGASLCAGTHDTTDPQFQLIVKPIDIGAKAWIAAEAFVGPGVSIGNGAIIGARAVLFKDALANGVYVGNPANLIKYRTVSY